LVSFLRDDQWVSIYLVAIGDEFLQGAHLLVDPIPSPLQSQYHTTDLAKTRNKDTYVGIGRKKRRKYPLRHVVHFGGAAALGAPGRRPSQPAGLIVKILRTAQHVCIGVKL
jgi:hypothetical protein